VADLHALAVAHGLSPATVAGVAAAGPDAVAAALRILGARTGPGSLDSAAAAMAPVFADSTGLRTGTGGPASTSATASAAVGHSPGMGALPGHGVGAMGAGGAPLFPGLLPLSGPGMLPATTPLSTTTFLRGVSPRPSTITAANSALAAALGPPRPRLPPPRSACVWPPLPGSTSVPPLSSCSRGRRGGALPPRLYGGACCLLSAVSVYGFAPRGWTPGWHGRSHGRLPPPLGCRGPAHQDSGHRRTRLQLHLLRSMEGPASPRSSPLRSRQPRPLRHSCPCSRPGVARPRLHRHVLDLWDHLLGSPGHRAHSRSHRACDVAFPRDSVSRVLRHAPSSSTPSLARSSRVTCP
jgi:hypothetical protein